MPINGRSLVSSNATLSPNNEVSTVAAAAEMPLCPLECSGKGGVCKNGCQLRSIKSLITVTGRMCWYLNFCSQQVIITSCIAIDESTYASALFSASAFAFLQAMAVMPIQCATGVIFLLPYIRWPEC